ncbi:MAG TPA: hypothetical protein VGJ70_07305 [Solirubrobacteraceae bacterium]
MHRSGYGDTTVRIGTPPLLGPALLGAVLAVLVAAPARATTETASSGAVSATLSYTKIDVFHWKDLRLQITRDGQPAFAGVPGTPQCKVPNCAPVGGIGEGHSLRVADLDGDGEPEVLVDLYSGGAHCCYWSELLRWTGSAYAKATRNWADFGYTLDQSPGGAAPLFVTGDARFAYEFASFADSRFPVRILSFRAGTWRDVTRAHPDALSSDAARLAKEYRGRRNGRYALGILAAWVADQYRLGRRAIADRFVAAELRAGRLKGLPPWPRGRAFVKDLHLRLKAWGYG